jgi:hypothetical protein
MRTSAPIIVPKLCNELIRVSERCATMQGKIGLVLCGKLWKTGTRSRCVFDVLIEGKIISFHVDYLEVLS